jgi:hypothetical protein
MFRQYTQCYNHTPGDKPFNKSDLAGFVAGTSAPGLIGAIIAFLSGANVIGFIIIAIQYAITIIAVANEWLFHRLVCVTGDQCAVGTVRENPAVSDFGEFDNDQFFDLRLMPHRENDLYKAPNNNFASGNPGPSQDGKTENHPGNDVYLDAFQGQQLLSPSITDLPYELTRSVLHCEAEGNFWQAMKDTAALQALAVGGGAALGAGIGAALGCAIAAIFTFGLGCLIGAIIGAIIGGFAGAAAGAYIGANAAFNSDPGNVEDANVGDRDLGPIQAGDRVVVFGTHVYDGFHEGWHEFHPLKAVMKFDPVETSNYLEWDPDFNDPAKIPPDTPDMDASTSGLTVADMKQGLDAKKFRARAEWLRFRWCQLVREAFDPPTLHTQQEPPHRWTIHPDVDGCQTSNEPPPIK